MSKPKRQTYYGSGTMYEFAKPATEGWTIPSTTAAIKAFVEEYALDTNQIGFLKNGFQVAVTTNTLTDQSDLGEMKIDVITEEQAQMTFALFNSNGETLERLYPTAKTVSGVTTVGGLANASQEDHVIMFVSANKNEDGEQTVFIGMGKNTSGFNINWNPTSVEPFSCQYTVVPFNTEGNLFRIADIAGLPSLPITSSTVYSISYELNGGEWAASYEAPDSYTTTGSDVTLPTSSNIEKDGATFGGWFEPTDLSTAVTTIDVSETTGNKTYLAKWTTG